MRCIFCKEYSLGSVSVEHIVPESLGNQSNVLPRGIVCDSCNNYFASKVEQPVLESPRFRFKRGMQAIANKRGRFPHVPGLAPPNVRVEMHREKRTGNPHIVINTDDDNSAVDRFFNSTKNGGGVLYFPADGTPPEKNVFSRFLAKMALEAIAQRLAETEGGIDYIVTETQFDPIRDHARRGTHKDWPYHERRIYPETSLVESSQVLHEYDFLVTDHGEWYFVIAVLGVEYSINLGGPEIEGYERWLVKNDGASPLYTGKNAKE
ncbi:MAG: HNH endonuclease [Deltaproteobacteria bacterium]|nr:HNH endonuclease [Deltaproteobacteria bacterium]